jgi:hypothetical protein
MQRFTRASCLTLGLLASLLASGAMAQGYSAWAHHRAVTIDNSANPAALSDYQVAVTLAAPDFDYGQASPQGEDLRFSDEGGLSELSHWIESWEPGGTSVIWVRVPAIPAADSTTILLHYGNPAAGPTSDGAATFLHYDGFESFNDSFMNAPQPLVTPTYDGSGQVVHPDVIYVPDGWNGFAYWLGMTPYPNGNDDWENPSILASNDNETWVVPPGVTNPLAPMPTAPGHNDDVDMVLVEDTLYLYWVETNVDGNSYIKLITSSDGVNWSAPQSVLGLPNYVMSPAIVHEAGAWRMWYATSPGGCTSGYQDIYLRTSSDGLSWGEAQEVAIDQPDRVVWHFDVQTTDAGYVMLFNSYPAGSNCANTNLYHAESADGLAWTVSQNPVLTPAPGGWDNMNVYRASFLADGTFYRIWYSARSTGGQWRVGYTEGELADFLAPPDFAWDELHGTMLATADHPRTGEFGLCQTGAATYPQLFKNLTDNHVCLTAWVYDDLSVAEFLLTVLRLWDSGNETYPLHPIGVGYYTGASPTHYAYHTEGFVYTPTALPRTEGWHQLAILAGQSACELRIDGETVATLDVLDENDLTRMSIEGYRGGNGWFDDVYLRRYVAPEPLVSVGPEISTAAPQGPLPAPFRLAQNYPNPLNPGTVIRFELAQAMTVRLEILDLQGRVVRTLVADRRQPGVHEVAWDGCDEEGRAAASGTYLYRLQGGGHAQTNKLTLIR